MWLARLHDQDLPKNRGQGLRAILGCATLRLKIQEGHNQSKAMLHQPKETASRGEDANRHTACSERGKRASLARRRLHDLPRGEASHSSKAEEKQATMSLLPSWWKHSPSDQWERAIDGPRLFLPLGCQQPSPGAKISSDLAIRSSASLWKTQNLQLKSWGYNS